MYHSLHRTDGHTLRVDADLWLGALDLAVVRGWKPRGTETPPGTEDDADQTFAYFQPRGQRVLPDDALELAGCLERALAEVPDSMLPLGGGKFGDENTLDLITRAARGEAPSAEEARTAQEILSGPPKSEALELVEFLRGGGFAIHPAD